MAPPRIKSINRHLWVIEPLADDPTLLVRPMFGGKAVYLRGRFILFLADKEEPWRGVLVPTERDHQPSLIADLPSLSPHPVLPKWLYLPEAADSFEADAQWLVAMLPLNSSVADRPVIIAHRGASGFLPEHTLESAAFAYAQGADYIEQDVVMSRDDVLVVSHDIHLDTTTDVATMFPDRHRDDGRYYAIDFDWAELKQLTVRERFDFRTQQPVFPYRFPANAASFRLCTMEEQILLISGLNQTTRRPVGLYPEIKQPAWHQTQGKDPGLALIELLNRYDFNTGDSPIFVQCFEPAELLRLRQLTQSPLKFIQLIGSNSAKNPDIDYDEMQTPAGLRHIATYAQGIGPSLSQIMIGADENGSPQFSSLVDDAHAAGLLVHPYTLRLDSLPPGIPDPYALVEIFLTRIQVDGIFTDHAGPVGTWVRQHFPPTR